MDLIEVRQILFGEAEYTLALKLRDEVLRRPLGIHIADDDLSGEAAALHIGAFIDFGAGKRLIGTLLLRIKDEQTLQMKQVAVDESLRGTGVGQEMVKFAEALAVAKGYREIVLNAREVALPFYDKLNYVREGERFEEIGIPHYVMRKQLD